MTPLRLSLFPGVVLSLLLSVNCAEQPPRPYLNAAVEVARWLRTTVVETDYGPVWPDDHLRPQQIRMGLGSGVAGRVLFFLALHDCTRRKEYLHDVHMGADYLLARLPSYLDDTTAARNRASLYAGLPAIGYALTEAYKATKDDRYRDGALACVTELHRLAVHDRSGVTWNYQNDILNGNAGTGLFLLYAAHELEHEPSIGLAARAADWLLARAIPDSGGLNWTVGAEADFILPNFSRGAAGIGLFLAGLFAETQDNGYFRAAAYAAHYLETIARKQHGLFLVPYGIPNVGFTRPHGVGWAHGPAGTARLFYRLFQATAMSHWADIVDACAYTVRQSGLPGPPEPDFGEVPFTRDMRFGSASAAMFLLDLYDATENRHNLNFARRLVSDIVRAATIDSLGMRWTQARHDFMLHPGEPAEFTGYFYGAAGYGLLLLRFDAAERRRDWKFSLPDNPFGARDL